MKQLSKHLTFANAISCIALFAVLSGAAYAAKTTLGAKAVKTQNLANGAVTTFKLRNGSVTSLKLRNGAVTGAKIAPETIGSSQLAKGAVRSAQLGGGVVTEGKLKNGAVSNEKIVDAAIATSKLRAQSVTAGKIAPEAVSATALSASFYSQLVKYVTYPAAVSPSDDTTNPKTAVAECPAHKQILGGGARVTGEETSAAVIESLPLNDSGGTRTKWMATARAIFPTAGKSWAVEAYAICAEF